MKKKVVVLILGCTLFMFENAGFAYESSPTFREYTGQVCAVGNNNVCSAITDEMMKEMIKQTIYAVGTRVLNKYASPVPVQTAAPVPVPAATTTTSTTVVQTAAPVVTTTTAPAAQSVSTPAESPTTSTNASPAEEMIILQ
jgi:hypothetical protein